MKPGRMPPVPASRSLPTPQLLTWKTCPGQNTQWSKVTSPPNFSSSIIHCPRDLGENPLTWVSSSRKKKVISIPPLTTRFREDSDINCKVQYTSRSFPVESDGVRLRQPEAGTNERGRRTERELRSDPRDPGQKFPALNLPRPHRVSAEFAWSPGPAGSRTHRLAPCSSFRDPLAFLQPGAQAPPFTASPRFSGGPRRNKGAVGKEGSGQGRSPLPGSIAAEHARPEGWGPGPREPRGNVG